MRPKQHQQLWRRRGARATVTLLQTMTMLLPPLHHRLNITQLQNHLLRKLNQRPLPLYIGGQRGIGKLPR